MLLETTQPLGVRVTARNNMDPHILTCSYPLKLDSQTSELLSERRHDEEERLEYNHAQPQCACQSGSLRHACARLSKFCSVEKKTNACYPDTSLMVP